MGSVLWMLMPWCIGKNLTYCYISASNLLKWCTVPWNKSWFVIAFVSHVLPSMMSARQWSCLWIAFTHIVQGCLIDSRAIIWLMSDNSWNKFFLASLNGWAWCMPTGSLFGQPTFIFVIERSCCSCLEHWTWPGSHLINIFELIIEILWKLFLLYQFWWSSHVTNLQMSQQLTCRVMCKIVT